MITILVLVLNATAWIGLALAMNKYSRVLLGKQYSGGQQLVLRLLAIAVMSLGVWLSVGTWGGAEGVIFYTIALFLPGVAVVLLLSTYSSKR